MLLRYIWGVFTLLVMLSNVNPLAAAPLSVREAVKRAVAVHPKTIAAQAIVSEALGERRRAVALPSPNLFIRWDDIPSGQALNAFTERRLGVSQEFDFPLKYFWLAQRADLSIKEAECRRLIALLDLEAEVKSAYLEAWAEGERAQILKTCSDTLSVYCERIQEQSRKGEAAPLAAQEYRVMALKAAQEYQSALRSSAAARQILARLMDANPEELELIPPGESDSGDTARFFIPPADSDNPYSAKALSHLKVQEASGRLAAYGWLPEFQLNYFSRNRLDRPNRDTWAVELEMTFPLWFGWDGVGRIQKVQAEINRARADYAAEQWKYISEYTRLTQELKSAEELFALYQQEIMPLTRAQFQSALMNLQLGGIDYTDYIEVWTDAKKILVKDVEVKRELCQLKIEFDRLCGWTMMEGNAE